MNTHNIRLPYKEYRLCGYTLSNPTPESKYSPQALPLEFSRIVAEATMDLPPMIRPQDGDFLRLVTEDVIDTFWSNYVALLSVDAQQEHEKAEDEETGEMLLQWHAKYANFLEDAAAERRGAQVLEEIAQKLPHAMQAEYEQFPIQMHLEN